MALMPGNRACRLCLSRAGMACRCWFTSYASIWGQFASAVFATTTFIHCSCYRNGMPMLIHMTFKDKGQFARHHLLSLASWAKENPDHAILMYDDADLRAYLRCVHSRQLVCVCTFLLLSYASLLYTWGRGGQLACVAQCNICLPVLHSELVTQPAYPLQLAIRA